MYEKRIILTRSTAANHRTIPRQIKKTQLYKPTTITAGYHIDGAHLSINVSSHSNVSQTMSAGLPVLSNNPSVSWAVTAASKVSASSRSRGVIVRNRFGVLGREEWLPRSLEFRISSSFIVVAWR